MIIKLKDLPSSVLTTMIADGLLSFIYKMANYLLSAVNGIKTSPISDNTEISTISYSELWDKYAEQITPDYTPITFFEKYKFGLDIIFRPCLFPISLSELGFIKFVLAIVYYLAFVLLAILVTYLMYAIIIAVLI